MKKIRILSLAMVCSMLFCTPIMAAEITTTEDAVIENNPEVVTESLESVKLEEMSPMSLSKEQYDVLSDDEIQTYGTTPDDYEENDSVSLYLLPLHLHCKNQQIHFCCHLL